MATDQCGCGSEAPRPKLSLKFIQPPAPQKPPFATGSVDTSAGTVWTVPVSITPAERREHLRCRFSDACRMRYNITPGLYAVGSPTPESEVLVTANYKLSFDHLRRELKGVDAWILVLDTKGINVWCAAGKGTFGTEELIDRIKATGLERVVTHRRVILPQLGAPGVSAHEVKRASGFHVHYGPVRASDLPEYLRAGRKAAPEMRRVRFTVADRLVLTPMEISPAMKHYPKFALGILLLFGLAPSGILFNSAFIGGGPFLVFGLVAVLAGALLTPVLLPIVPSRAFSVKGWLMGVAALLLVERLVPGLRQERQLAFAAAYLFFPLAASYIALQFTGATTYTGISGVKKELKRSLPIYIGGTVVAAFLLVADKIMMWGKL